MQSVTAARAVEPVESHCVESFLVNNFISLKLCCVLQDEVVAFETGEVKMLAAGRS